MNRRGVHKKKKKNRIRESGVKYSTLSKNIITPLRSKLASTNDRGKLDSLQFPLFPVDRLGTMYDIFVRKVCNFEVQSLEEARSEQIIRNLRGKMLRAFLG